MAMTFDATLKDMARDCPHGFLAAFDGPPTLPVALLNVDLSTVTTATDLILGLVLSADVGVAPLAMLGRLPDGSSLEDGLAGVARRVVDRVIAEAASDRAKKLLTDAFLLTGLRVRRNVASRIFKGIHAMQESDTYLMILDEGQEKSTRDDILIFGEERFGPPNEEMRAQLNSVTDLPRLKRMVRRAAKAADWREIVETP